jgi:hypothetical protein
MSWICGSARAGPCSSNFTNTDTTCWSCRSAKNIKCLIPSPIDCVERGQVKRDESVTLLSCRLFVSVADSRQDNVVQSSGD